MGPLGRALMFSLLFPSLSANQKEDGPQDPAILAPGSPGRRLPVSRAASNTFLLFKPPGLRALL